MDIDYILNKMLLDVDLASISLEEQSFTDLDK